VSEKTLARWSSAGLIGRVQVVEGGAVLYVASDIADLIASKLTPRRIVPATPAAEPEPSNDWRAEWDRTFRSKRAPSVPAARSKKGR
jgi:hypothetical protein